MTMIEKLRKHLKETPHEQLVKEWNELDDWKDIGPTVEEFLKVNGPVVLKAENS